MQITSSTAAQRCAGISHAPNQGKALSLPERLMERIKNISQMPRFNFGVSSGVGEALRKLMAERGGPALTDAAHRYERVEGELFGAGGPSIEDIKQGQLGDCSFLSAVGSIVAEDPSKIKDMIRDNKDGTYSVKFTQNPGSRSAKEVWVTVNGDLPVDKNGNLAYAKGADSDGDGKLELWVPIMEKAYAKFRADQQSSTQGMGYNAIASHPDDAYEHLTGENTYRKPASEMTSSMFANALEGVNEDHNVMVATHPNSKDVEAGWAANHAYTVVGTFDLNGEAMVILRNPWGTMEPDGAMAIGEANDGMFAVSADELKAQAQTIYSTEQAQSSTALKTFNLVSRI